MNYWNIDKNTFKKQMPEIWKQILENEFQEFGSLFKLYWFSNTNEIIGGFCLWYNPDYFKEKIDKLIINCLNDKKYKKISYFYIIDKYRWERKGWELLLEFMKNNWWKYYLTCDNISLKDYYISLWFKLYNTNLEKFILVFENNK